MNIKEFIANYHNHPVLFVGTGMSLRYLKKSYTWNGLLEHIACELTGNNEYYLNVKSDNMNDSECHYDKVASELEKYFNNSLKEDINGKFKEINDIFFSEMEKGRSISRFKLYISKIFEKIEIAEEKNDEIAFLKKVRKNIGSVITTNYDQFIEEIFEFTPLIGNDILLSNPYGSVYKIHGCITQPDKIIITNDDYNQFNKKYELIRAQLLSLFIHNPIIFIGYNIGDDNIRNILKTIFFYVPNDSDIANKIKSNFLLVEYEPSSDNTEVCEHDITIDGGTTIRVNKIKTDNFSAIYEALSDLQLPISAMDIRKVQNVVKEIYSGGKIQVSITENIDDLNNCDRVLAIGTNKTIRYDYQTTSEMMCNYFNIIEEENKQLISLIDKQTINTSQYFPIFGFGTINSNLIHYQRLEEIQLEKIEEIKKQANKRGCQHSNSSIDKVMRDNNISASKKTNAICYGVLNQAIDLNDLENFLRNYSDKQLTDYRKMLCLYDYMRYG